MMAMQRRSGVSDLHVPKVLIRVLLDEGQPQAKGGKHPLRVRQWIPAIGCALRVFLPGASFLRGLGPTPEPTINLTLESVNRTALPMKLPMDRQVFMLPPALDGTHFPVQVNRNLFPRVETLSVPLQRRWDDCPLQLACLRTMTFRDSCLPQIHFTLFLSCSKRAALARTAHAGPES